MEASETVSQRRMFVYKIVHDTGGAPCIDDGLFSLALCKPEIRRTAQKGDWIFAFGTNSEHPPNRLVYIAEVTDRISDARYYDVNQYQHRLDCIYRRARNGVYVLRDDAQFHIEEDARKRDIGAHPNYARAIVLISNDFRYFGGDGDDDWKQRAPALAKVVANMKQGHRVNHSRVVRDELLNLKKRLWHQHRANILGTPLHRTDDLVLNLDDACDSDGKTKLQTSKCRQKTSRTHHIAITRNCK